MHLLQRVHRTIDLLAEVPGVTQIRMRRHEAHFVNKLPRHLLVNRLPLHPHESFFTLQSTGFAFCPYRVQSEARFVVSLAALGYSVVDHWNVPELSCQIPFAPERSFKGYQGFALCLQV